MSQTKVSRHKNEEEICSADRDSMSQPLLQISGEPSRDSGLYDAPVARREERRREVSDKIIRIAEQCFQENGYAATAMSEIAIRLGGSKSTLWNHFRSKDRLFAAVIRTNAARFEIKFLSLLDVAGTPRTVLQRFTFRFVEAISSAEAISLQRMVISETGRFPQIGAIFHAQAPAAMGDLLSAYMKQQMANGTIRTDDPRAAGQMLLALARGGLHQRILLGLEAYCTRTAKAEAVVIVDQFMRAFSVRSDER
jgi:AcrR family transcriptional regulator